MNILQVVLIDDEFDQIWEEDEEQRRQQAQFKAWYWELN
jgi:hypothetical protein